MQTRLTLRPDDPGTKKLLAEHGDRLLRVRYVYDADARKRYKTIELIVEERFWMPSVPTSIQQNASPHPQQAGTCAVQIGYDEKDLQRKAREAGGRWNPQRRWWEISKSDVQRLGLSGRVIQGNTAPWPGAGDI